MVRKLRTGKEPVLLFFKRPVPTYKKSHTTVALLIGESFPTLGSAASQHLAAIGGCHSLAETMFHLAMPFFG